MTENMWNESIARGEMRNEATTIWFRILMVALHLCIGIPTVVNTLFNVITINMPSPQNFMAYSNTDIIDSRQVMKKQRQHGNFSTSSWCDWCSKDFTSAKCRCVTKEVWLGPPPELQSPWDCSYLTKEMFVESLGLHFMDNGQ